MTLDALLDRVDLERPNAWTRAQKTAWVSDLEASLWTQLLLQPQGLWRPLDPDGDGGTRLLLPDGWMRLYTSYLFATIDLSNGEFDRYQNSMVVYNAFLAELGAWYAAAFAPAQRQAEWTELGTAAYDELAEGVRFAGAVPAGAALLAVGLEAAEPFAGSGKILLSMTDGTRLGEADMIGRTTGLVRAVALPLGGEGIEVAAPKNAFTAGALRLYARFQRPADNSSRFT